MKAEQTQQWIPDARLREIASACADDRKDYSLDEVEKMALELLAARHVPSAAPTRDELDLDILQQAADYLYRAGDGPMVDRLRLLHQQLALSVSAPSVPAPALKPWLVHYQNCANVKMEWRDGDEATCTCGLAKALTQEGQ